jgi:sensor domain CHASE-containing protein
MSLQKKLAAALAGVVAIGFLAAWAVLGRFVYPSFDALQKRMAENDLMRVEVALDGSATAVDAANFNWAQWDSAHDFVRGEKEEFEKVLLDPLAFQELDLNMMLFFDARGEFYWGQYLESETGRAVPLDEVLIELPRPDDPLTRHAKIDSAINGILQTRMGAMLVTSRPILTDKGTGPIAGALVSGRLLDERQIADLEAQTRTTFDLVPLDGGALTESDRKALIHLTPDAPFHTRGEEHQLSYRTLRDVYGEPAYLLRSSTPRDVAGVGLDALQLAMLLFGVMGLLFALTTWGLVQRLIVAPLCALTHHVATLRESRNLSLRISMRRGDEIGTLAAQFDALTEELEAARDEAAKRREPAS